MLINDNGYQSALDSSGRGTGMRRLTLAGNEFELSQEQYWNLIRDAATASCICAQTVCSEQLTGFVDVAGKRAIGQLNLAKPIYQELMSQIEDEPLRGLFGEMEAQMEALNQINERLIEYLALIFGLAVPLSPKERRRLDREVNNSNPKWVLDDNYKIVAQEAMKAVELILSIEKQILDRISTFSTPGQEQTT
jgi:hypothetical protein